MTFTSADGKGSHLATGGVKPLIYEFPSAYLELKYSEPALVKDPRMAQFKKFALSEIVALFYRVNPEF